MIRLVGIVLGLGMIAIPGMAAGQTGDFAIPAGSALPNYDRISIGQREGIEANAFVARTNDAGANWYNPAGLAQSERSSLNASANAYEFTGLALVGTETARGGTRFSTIGSFFGGVIGAPIIKSDRWRLGFSFTKPVSWQPSRDRRRAAKRRRDRSGRAPVLVLGQPDHLDSRRWPSAIGCPTACGWAPAWGFAITSLNQRCLPL